MAGNLHVHMGQAGIQLGIPFWQRSRAGTEEGEKWKAVCCRIAIGKMKKVPLDNNDNASAVADASSLFCDKGSPAAVFLDSEPKVINELRNSKNLHDIMCEDAICADQSGRANNWAMGFIQFDKELQMGRGFAYKAVNAVRRQIERMDHVRSVNLFHSIAGGTGSGAGSAMLQYLRETCPSLTISTCSIAPFTTGEVVTQWYNSAFCLNALVEYADSIIFRSNDSLLHHYMKSRSLGSSTLLAAKELAASEATMTALNESLAADLAGLMLPTRRPGTSHAIPYDGPLLAQTTCPFRHAKLLSLYSTYSTTTCHSSKSTHTHQPLAQTWASICRSLLPYIPSRDTHNQPISTLTSHVIIRGLCSKHYPDNPNSYFPLGTIAPQEADITTYLQTDLPKALRFVHWQGHGSPSVTSNRTIARTPQVRRESVGHLSKGPHIQGRDEVHVPRLPSGVHAVYSVRRDDHKRGRQGGEGVTVVANRTDVLPYVEKVVDRATEMEQAKAYVHWYYRYGLEEADFLAAFEGCRRITEEYRELGASEWSNASVPPAPIRAIRDYLLR